MFSIRAFKFSVIAVGLCASIVPAQAAMLYSDAVLLRGAENLTSVELPVDAIGSYRVTATDLKWFGAPLQALSFGVFTATQPLKIMDGAGTLEFFKSSPGKTFLQIYAKTSGPQFANLLAIQVESLAPPVPLPASLGLLGSALGSAWLIQARRQLRRGLGRIWSALRSISSRAPLLLAGLMSRGAAARAA